MKPHGISRRTLTTAVLMLAAAVGGVVGFSFLGGDSEPAQGSEPQVLLLVGGDLGGFTEFESIAKASRVESFDEAKAVTQAAPALVMVDSTFAANLKNGELRSLVTGGSAIIGLDVPLGQLNELAGFEEELRSINPRFAGHGPPDEQPASAGQFYSLIWRSPEGSDPVYWGRLQHSLSDGLFEATIRQHKLLVQGLINEGDRVVPIEQYGRE
jgi:hypothetical protein